MTANTVYDALSEGRIPQPVTLVDLTGTPYVASGGGGGGGTVNIADGTTSSQKLAIDASGKIGINNFPGFTFDGSGYLQVNIKAGGAGGSAGTGATSDAIAASSMNELGVALYNGSTFDRLRGDNTGEARVSLYGKYSVAGDTPIGVDASGNIGIRNFPYKFDANGNLYTNAFAPGYLSNSGGPANSAGTPSGFAFDLIRSLQGKASNGGATITTTAAGDTALAFSSAPLNLLAGSPVILTGGGNPVEAVYVSQSFVPGSGVTSVPLQGAGVRYAGHTTAYFDVYNATGPQFNPFSPIGLKPVANTYWNPSNAAPNQHELLRGSNGWLAQQDFIAYMIAQGAGYSATTDIQTTSANGTFPVALWAPLKNIILYSITVSCSIAGYVKLTQASANPAYGTALSISNNQQGGSASACTATMTNTSTTFSGTSIQSIPFPQAIGQEILISGKKLFNPGYQSRAWILWLTTQSQIATWAVTFNWIEF